MSCCVVKKEYKEENEKKKYTWLYYLSHLAKHIESFFIIVKYFFCQSKKYKTNVIYKLFGASVKIYIFHK